MRRSPANSTNRSLAAFGKLQHIRQKSFRRFGEADFLAVNRQGDMVGVTQNARH